jgi:hypothetical protein
LNATESQIGLVWLSGFIPHISGVFITVFLIKKSLNFAHLDLEIIHIRILNFLLFFIFNYKGTRNINGYF